MNLTDILLNVRSCLYKVQRQAEYWVLRGSSDVGEEIMMGKERGIMFGEDKMEIFILLVVFVSSLPLWFHKFLFYNNLLSCIL